MEAADFPRAIRKAKDHIRHIRWEKGLGSRPEQIANNAADLEAALKMLSNDLYQTATHFLLELIQNADDSYPSPAKIPALFISYSKSWMGVDCNERDFTKNVGATCQSAKSGRSKSADFVVKRLISSCHYSFPVDRDAHL